MKKIGLLIIVSILCSCLINNKAEADKDLKILTRTSSDLNLALQSRENKNDKLSQAQSQVLPVGFVHAPYGDGSGVLVKPNKVITATHVTMKPNRRMTKPFLIKYYPYGRNSDVLQEQAAPIRVKSVKQLNNSEITILTLEKPIKNIKPLKLSKEQVEDGESVKSIGYHDVVNKDWLNYQYTSKGNVAFSRKDLKNLPYDAILAHIKNDLGMSGGPLLNNKNEVIGISSFKYNKHTYAGYISTKNVKESDLK